MKKGEKKNVTDLKKPKKQMKSIWVVLITTFLTTLIVGGGFVGYLYWEENFKTEAKVEITQEEEKIEGENVVIVTSDNEKLFINFYNPENNKEITKQVEIETTLQGGYWAKKNKNELVQFDEAGNYFYAMEVKEPSLSDDTEYAKIVKYSKDGTEKETILESENYLAYSNYLYNEGKLYYLSSALDEAGGVESWDLSTYDIFEKKETVVTEDVGDYFEKELLLKNNKIESLYKQGSYIYKVTVDLDSKELEKKYLFRATYSTSYQLTVSDVFSSPYENKYVYKDYSTWEGYSLKLYDEETRKSEVLMKDKDISFSDIGWVSKNEISFIKTPVFSGLDQESSNSLVKIDVTNPSVEGVYVKSEELLKPIILTEDYQLYFEDSKLVCKTGEEEKELTPMSLTSISDILFVGVIDYSVDSEE